MLMKEECSLFFFSLLIFFILFVIGCSSLARLLRLLQLGLASVQRFKASPVRKGLDD